MLETLSVRLLETINPEDAHTDHGAMMSVLRGNRSVAFLMGPFVKQWYKKYIKDHPTAKLAIVKRDGVGYYGDGYVLYTDVNKAKNLLRVLNKHEGYLPDETPEDTIENGEALEYDDSAIKAYVDDHYGYGTYDRIKLKH